MKDRKMKPIPFIFLLLALVSGRNLAPLHQSEEKIPNEFNIFFKPAAQRKHVRGDVRHIEQHIAKLKASGTRVHSDSAILADIDYERFSFVSVRLHPSQLERLRKKLRTVDYIAENAVVKMSFTQAPPPWNLGSLDLTSTTQYQTNATGCGINIYILDSGIQPTNNDFTDESNRSRVKLFKSYVNNPTADCNGHGTFCAGIIGSKTYGTAKRSNLFSVPVLNCSGMGTTSTVLIALNDIRLGAQKPAIVHLSFETPSVALDLNQGLAAVTAAGITVVGPAGNAPTSGFAADACLRSPASAPSVIAVAALDSTNTRASWSNFGSCVTLFAPGSSVRSWDIVTPSQETTRSGTSCAAAHATGLAALFLETNPQASPAAVKQALVAGTVSGVLNAGTGSPNRKLRVLRTADPPTCNTTAGTRCNYTCLTACVSPRACIWGECRCKSYLTGPTCNIRVAEETQPLPAETDPELAQDIATTTVNKESFNDSKAGKRRSAKKHPEYQQGNSSLSATPLQKHTKQQASSLAIRNTQRDLRPAPVQLRGRPDG